MNPKNIRAANYFFAIALTSISFTVLGAGSEIKVGSSKEDVRLACPDTPSGRIRANLLTRTYENYSDGSRRNVTDWRTAVNNCPEPLDKYTILYVMKKYTTQNSDGKSIVHRSYHPYRLEKLGR
ncbi:hypothetical protein GHO40_16865 [Pseudomonas helleri]|uniref:Uncharacterized protein n=1 Tax=Pseudomonas helleri TaxID=1608996 RepID=A0A7X2BJE0_9PSED|nr:hypothetical protein [Pseudomonas helleri]MQT48378.1 hypothetical protein [Pseudomonas helleri]